MTPPNTFVASALPSAPAPPADNGAYPAIIMTLLFVIAMSMMGVDMFMILSNFGKEVRRIAGPPINGLFSGLGYSTGTIIDRTADVAADTAKVGVDIAEGTVQSVGDLLIKASGEGVRSLDDSVNRTRRRPSNDPRPSDGALPAQKSISAGKAGWCLVGEYQGMRGCASVGEADKCLSGQRFASQALCMNPTQSNNMQGQPQRNYERSQRNDENPQRQPHNNYTQNQYTHNNPQLPPSGTQLPHIATGTDAGAGSA